MRPLYISFYTEQYKPDADELIGTLKQFNLDYDVRPVLDTGSWVRNCAKKARFVADMMLWHPDRPIVWADADARIRRDPKLFDTLDCDVAFHLRHEVELLSGTLYFGPTTRAVQLVADWWRRCVEDSGRLDQELLHEAVKDMTDLRIQHLPASYVRIFDGDDLGPLDEAVVLHLQSSRKFHK